MKNFSLHLKSADAGNIYINGQFVGLIDNVEEFSVDLSVYGDSLVVTKEPISKQKKLLLPYTVRLKIKNNLIECDSDLVSIIPFKNNEFDVILQPCQINSNKPLKKVYDDFVDTLNVVVVNDGQSYVNIYQYNMLKYSNTIQEINSIVCYKKNEHIIVKGATLNGKYYLLIINQNTFETLYSGEAEKLEEEDSQIKLLNKLNDIAKHGKVTVIDLQSGNTLNEYFVYLNNSATMCYSDKLVPYAFLEAIKIENYGLALEYLSPNLKQNTTKEHLKKYFENVEEIYYNTYLPNEVIANYTVKSFGQYKSYDFIVKNNKIEEIEEVELKTIIPAQAN